MRLYACSVCDNQLYFESYRCTRCGSALGFIASQLFMTALKPKDDGRFEALEPTLAGQSFAYCANHDSGSCNWLISDGDQSTFCRSCRLTSTIPDLSDEASRSAWVKLEQAKRRLLYTLLRLGLPFESSNEPSLGLSFQLLQGTPSRPVVTGHARGVVTINVAEADAAYRENERVRLGEAYRTTLGHFRHEVGHYYFDRLVADGPFLDRFRDLFGDERADYEASMKRHYESGPLNGFEERFVSGYASMHPWEDWAETWAHYLHIVDTLETAQSYGLSVKAPEQGGQRPVRVSSYDLSDFDSLMELWLPVTLALNGLNRSMGLADAYPFLISETVKRKLAFVHEIVRTSRE